MRIVCIFNKIASKCINQKLIKNKREIDKPKIIVGVSKTYHWLTDRNSAQNIKKIYLYTQNIYDIETFNTMMGEFDLS